MAFDDTVVQEAFSFQQWQQSISASPDEHQSLKARCGRFLVQQRHV